MTSANYDRTLLWSGAPTSTCNLSEPISAFDRFIILADRWEYEFKSISACTQYKMPMNGWWSNEAYLRWSYRFTISNNAKTVTLNRFQMIYQVGTAAPKTFGFNNTAGNIKKIAAVYGVNRLVPVTQIGSGSPGDGWRAYNETVIYSGGPSGTLAMSEPASAFERLKIGVGNTGESFNYFEVDAPKTNDSYLTTESHWGNNTGSYYYGFSRWHWSPDTTVLSSLGGKQFQLGINQVNPYTATGDISNSNFIRRPIQTIIGINHI